MHAIIKGERDTINGFPVTWYQRGGNRVAVAEWEDLGPGRAAQATMESFFGFLDTMSQGGFQSSDNSFFEAMDEIGGFPVAGESEDLDDEKWTLESVTERDLDPDAFEPPAGYRLRTMGGFFSVRPETQALLSICASGISMRRSSCSSVSNRHDDASIDFSTFSNGSGLCTAYPCT